VSPDSRSSDCKQSCVTWSFSISCVTGDCGDEGPLAMAGDDREARAESEAVAKLKSFEICAHQLQDMFFEDILLQCLKC